MKNNILLKSKKILILISCTSVIFFTSCAGNGKISKRGKDLNIIEYEGKDKFISYQVTYPDFKKHKEIGKKFKKITKNEINSMRNLAKEDYQVRKQWLLAEGISGQSELKNLMMPYDYEFNFKDYYENQDILNFFMSSYQYCGGAHGFHTLISYCYDKNKERFLTPQEFKAYLGITEEEISAFVRKEAMNEENLQDCIDEQWIRSGTEPNDHCFDIIYYDGNRNILEIFIPPYQIGPYACGSFLFEYPLKAAQKK